MLYWRNRNIKLIGAVRRAISQWLRQTADYSLEDYGPQFPSFSYTEASLGKSKICLNRLPSEV
jgi:hypothetical protein